MIDLKTALLKETEELAKISTSARIDAEILLGHVLQVSRSYLYGHPELELNNAQFKTYQALVKQRAEGMPIAYLTGTREFWSLQLQVSKDTLIPRPETELLVEKTLELIAPNLPAEILELGTGSGAIALALASERPHWHIHACDQNSATLSIAIANATRLGLTHVNFFLSDWFTQVKNQQFHAIVSNPPYIAADDSHLHEGDVRFEPHQALVSGVDGLDALHYIIEHSYNRLLPNGVLLLEHGYDQGMAVTELLKHYGYADVKCWQDWQGHDRISTGKRNSEEF